MPPKTWILYQLSFGGWWEREVTKIARTSWHEKWRNVKEWRDRVINRSWSLVMTAVDCIWLAADLNWIPACSPPSLHGTAFQEQQNMSDCRCTNGWYRTRSFRIRITKCIRQSIYLLFLVGFSWLREEKGHGPARTAMILRVPYKGENFLKSWVTSGFSIINFFQSQLID
jgi:hypothetical protein